MNKKKGTFVGFWIVAVLLVGFYLSMMVWGMNPQVGIEYRMYYLTHELSDWPGYGGLTYSLGTVEYCAPFTGINDVPFTLGKVNQRKGQGFLKVHLDGSESTGDASYVYYIPDESKEGVTYTFEISEYKGDGETTVYVGDQAIGTFNQVGKYSFDLGSITKDELLTIKYVTNNCSFRLWTTCLQ